MAISRACALSFPAARSEAVPNLIIHQVWDGLSDDFWARGREKRRNILLVRCFHPRISKKAS